MRSPRFDIRSAKLRSIFSPTKIEQAWTKKVRVSMRDQITNDGIENFDFHLNRKIECEKLSHTILSGDYVPYKSQRILVEKSKGLCRQLVIPSVKDAIVLQCLSDALYGDIRGKAPTNKSYYEPKDHRFSSSVQGYGTLAAWLNFQKALFNFSKTRRYIVVTDIANYYDSISYAHLRNTISAISGVEECVLDMLIYVLSDLLWQPDYSPRIEVGLPQINLDAPRLLAHCFLYELDSFLISKPGIDFVRYMDDLDVGVDSIVDAKHIIKSIDLVLQTKQVRLNSGKTSILTSGEAIKHFRVLENFKIDTVKASVELRSSRGLDLDRQKKLIELRIKRGVKKKEFDTGNGDKIFKRWIGLAAKSGAKVDAGIIGQIIKLRPAIRDAAYKFIRSRPLVPSVASIIADAVDSGLLVDDAAIVEIANHLTETLVIRRNCHKYILKIINIIDHSNHYGVHSKMWLQSKYDSADNLLKTIIDTKEIWSRNEQLGRLVGSFLPLLSEKKQVDAYNSILSSAMNAGSRDTYRFHVKLSRDLDAFNGMFDALSNVNPSRGTGITHAKFLCLLSALQNSAVPKARKDIIKLKNATALSDVYYRRILKNIGVI